MKKIIIPAVIFTIFGGGFYVANESYNEKVSSVVETISENLKNTGYSVSYEGIESGIVNQYISINSLKLTKGEDVINVDEVKVHRDSFKSANGGKPHNLDFSIKNMKLSESFQQKGAYNVNYVHKYNDNNGDFSGKISVKNQDSADFSFLLNLGDATNLWNCLDQTINECRVSLTPEDLDNALGNASIKNIDIEFKNNGIIEERFASLYSAEIDIEEIKKFAEVNIKNTNIKDANKVNLLRFVKELNHLKINLSQKENQTIRNIVDEFIDKAKKNEISDEKEFTDFLVEQFDIEIE